MAHSTVDWSSLKGLDSSNSGVCSVECTVVTGFEFCAEQEAKKKLGVDNVQKNQGRIIFDVSPDRIGEVLALRNIDNAWVLIGAREKFEFKGEKAENLASLIALIPELGWDKGLDVWRKVFNYEGRIKPQVEEVEEDPEPEKKARQDDAENGGSSSALKFRCTCYRSGTNHNFSSMDAAREFGGAVQDKFKWTVKMKGYDLDVVINIDTELVYCGVALTRQSLFKRNIEHFGPTTLRATICSALLTIADIKPGDVVVDPMCGGGSIPIEGDHTY